MLAFVRVCACACVCACVRVCVRVCVPVDDAKPGVQVPRHVRPTRKLAHQEA